MLRRLYEIRQFSPVLECHWTNILIVGFLQVRVRVQSHAIDNVRSTSVPSSEGSTRSRPAMQWLTACVAARVLNSETSNARAPGRGPVIEGSSVQSLLIDR